SAFHCSRHHQALHSFPTRRSSDLCRAITPTGANPSGFCAVGAQFNRDRILLREWNIWYFLMNRMSVGATVAWYDASNIRQALARSEEHTSELQSRGHLVCRLLLEK